MPELSIVIPTRRRRTTLESSLRALARQDVTQACFEVIVVADGAAEESLPKARDHDLPFELLLCSQPRSGAAAARNHGAGRARAPVLLFLDDDMAADRALVGEHLARHADPFADVVLGHFSQSPEPESDPLLAANVRTWWSRRFREMARPAHRFSFVDVFSGHFSVKRDLFHAVGGFDERFTHEHSGEDYELGVRLLAEGARFKYAPRAHAVHVDDPTVERALGRAFADGRGHSIIARSHPDVLTGLPVGSALYGSGPVPRSARRPRVPALRMGVAGALKLRRVWGTLFGLVHRRAYWAGVLTELGSHRELARLFQEAELTPSGSRLASFDLLAGYPALADLLRGTPVDALDVWIGDRPICRVPHVPAAEPLRPPHVVEWLARHHATSVVEALASVGWTLDGERRPERGGPNRRVADMFPEAAP